ncbi:MAG: sugar phosphate isomerase/epimerase [Paludisphaera borealis]|uniref:sugar phosphate isomerase/epimerase family protein n=1 Tax=Paludisphaera borealis TaxID=1387353 RepID=UPI00283BF62A|nr:sugar phosphate isomerase/epimerase family protein [Paludisphaera borealis]MDR3623031.1 sugar phosphate isomerase/epimerase [Paludisphaera borealis]
MIPCISQATTMSTSLEADLTAYPKSGWTTIELWLTKVETYLRDHTVADLRALLDASGLRAAAASAQGGLLLSRGAERAAHWEHFRSRLAVLRELDVPTLVVAVDFNRELKAEDYPLAAASLAEAGELAGSFGVRLAVEFQKGAAFCSSLDTTLALIAQCRSPHVGVCLDLFHYYTGPSKFEDLAYLDRNNLAWVQICDLSGTPRELAGDGDRIFPGEGDFQIEPILDHLGAIGYDGPVSLEVLNPHLWRIPVDRVADLGYQAVCRALGRWNRTEPEGSTEASSSRPEAEAEAEAQSGGIRGGL